MVARAVARAETRVAARAVVVKVVAAMAVVKVVAKVWMAAAAHAQWSVRHFR